MRIPALRKLRETLKEGRRKDIYGGAIDYGNLNMSTVQKIIDRSSGSKSIVSSAVNSTGVFKLPAVEFKSSITDIGLWHLNEGSGLTATDASNNGNDLLISDCEWNPSSKFNSGLTLDSGWYSSEWRFRIKLTIAAANIPSSQVDFPVYVSGDIMPASFFTQTMSSGYDVVVTDSDGVTILSYELVHFDQAINGMELFFKAPALSSTEDNIFYIYFGNPSAINQENPADVWTNEYIAVFHLSETAAGTGSLDVYRDSLGLWHSDDYVDPGTKDGKLYATGGDAFDGGDYIAMPPAIGGAHSGDPSASLSMWFKRTAGDGTNRRMFDSTASTNISRIMARLTTTNKIEVGGRSASADTYQNFVTTATYIDSDWHYLVANINIAGDDIDIYVDGSLMDGSGTPAWTPTTFSDTYGPKSAIGAASEGTSERWLGSLDEVRISSTARDANWVTIEYNNQSAPGTFMTVGSTQDISSGWYNEAWKYRVKLTIPSTAVTETLSNFPVYVSGSILPDVLFDSALANGYDILFTEADGITQIPYERVHWVPASNGAELHFRATSISHTSDTEFYIYFGNPNQITDMQDADAVWSNSFVAVYHLGESAAGTGTADTYIDSLGIAHGDDYVDPGNKLGYLYPDGGEYFDSGDYIVCGTSSNIDLSGNNFTISLWIKGPPSTSKDIIGSKGGVAGAGFTISQGANRIFCGYGAGTNGRYANIDQADEWMHFAFTRAGLVQVVPYANGSPSAGSAFGVSSTETGTNNTAMNINGRGNYNAKADDISLDEIRISNTARSAGWIAAEYANQSSISSFIISGNIETKVTYVQPQDWYNTNWKYRVKITIEAGKVSSDLADFPVYVSESVLPNYVFDNSLTNGYDVIFTSSDGRTLLAFERVHWDKVNRRAEFHFKAPSILSASNNDFYVYFCNKSQSADFQNAASVWSNGYIAVYHLGETGTGTGSTDIYKSSVNGYHMDDYVDPGTKFGKLYPTGGETFDNSNDYCLSNDAFTGIAGSGPLTFSVWAYRELGNPGVYDGIWASGGGSNTTFRCHFLFYAAQIRLHLGDGTAGTTSSAALSGNPRGSWFHVAAVWDGTAVQFYQGGSPLSTPQANTRVIAALPDAKSIGRTYTTTTGADYVMHGALDELRISSAVRTSAWMAAEYANQSDPATFFTVGLSESKTSSLSTTNWYNLNWKYRIQLTIPASEVDAELSNFPVYVSGAALPDAIFDLAHAHGYDIVFTSSDGKTVLPYERVHWDGSTNSAELHFKATSLSNVDDNIFYIYFGNALQSIDLQTPELVWSEGYEAVYHFTESAAGTGIQDVYTDSLYMRHGADYVDIGGKNGKLHSNGGETFNGTGDYIEFGDWPTSQERTVSIWVYPTTTDANQRTIVAKRNSSGETAGTTGLEFWLLHASNVVTLILGDSALTINGPAGSMPVNEWTYVAASIGGNGTTGILATNDTQTTEDQVAAITDRASVWQVGARTGDIDNRRYAGSLDELRISNVARSSEWISTEYANQSSPLTFIIANIIEELS